MPTTFSQSVIAPRSVTVRTNENTMVLSTTNTEATLQTSVLNLDVDQLHVNGSTADEGQVVMQGPDGPYWADITSLSDVSSIDGSGLTIGSSGVSLGNTSYTTNLRGNVVLDGSAGSSGQFITSDGTKARWQTVRPNLSAILSFGNNAGGQGIFACSSIDADTVLAVGQTTPQTIIGKSSGETDIQGVLKINGSAGNSGQVLTSSGGGGVNPSWTSINSNVPQLGTVLKTGADAAQVGIYNLPFVDASNEALTIGGQYASSVVLGTTGRTVDIMGNLNVASTAPVNGGLFVGNGTTASFQTSVPTETLEFYSNSSYVAIDNSTNCVKVGTLGGRLDNCAIHTDYIAMLDLSLNEHRIQWENNQGVLSLIPNNTGQLQNQWQSQNSNKYVNLSGYQSNYVNDASSGAIYQPNHALMNNNYVAWLRNTSGNPTESGRTFHLYPLSTAYANNLRFTLRNDSGDSVLVDSSDNIIGFPDTLVNNASWNFAAVEQISGFAWLRV